MSLIIKGNFQKIKDLIYNSTIPLSEKQKLTSLFIQANDQELELVLNLFTQDSSWISKINDNYKDKSTAVANNNSELWKKIIEDEESQLQKI